MTSSAESPVPYLEQLRRKVAGPELPVSAPATAPPPVTMGLATARILAALDVAPKLLDDERAARVAYQAKMVLGRFDSVARSTTAWRAVNRLEAAQRAVTAFVSTLRWCSSSAQWEELAAELAADLEALHERMDELRRRERELEAAIHEMKRAAVGPSDGAAMGGDAA